jgi:peptidoglycan-associated lipoprotein
MRSILSCCVSLVAAVACSHAQPAPPAAQQVAERIAPPAAVPVPVAAPVFVMMKPLPEVAPASVYFDFDGAELSPEARATLQSFFEQAEQRPEQRIRIEGNCDERGTREYNLALGQRRADAAKKYLVNLGLDPSRIVAVSNGKERPLAMGSDAASRSQNRRDDLVPISAASAATASADGE